MCVNVLALPENLFIFEAPTRRQASPLPCNDGFLLVEIYTPFLIH